MVPWGREPQSGAVEPGAQPGKKTGSSGSRETHSCLSPASPGAHPGAGGTGSPAGCCRRPGREVGVYKDSIKRQRRFFCQPHSSKGKNRGFKGAHEYARGSVWTSAHASAKLVRHKKRRRRVGVQPLKEPSGPGHMYSIDPLPFFSVGLPFIASCTVTLD